LFESYLTFVGFIGLREIHLADLLTRLEELISEIHLPVILNINFLWEFSSVI